MQRFIDCTRKLRNKSALFDYLFWFFRHIFNFLRYQVYRHTPEHLFECAMRKRVHSYKGKYLNKINKSSFDDATKNTLINLATSMKNFDEHIELFLSCKISRVNNALFCNSVICICIVHNELMRMRLFLNHYRGLGVKVFAILDDHSNDGTREFLLHQKDVILYESPDRYTTVLREVWINRIIAELGLNKWYLIVDSDELLDYPDSEVKSISLYIKGLEETGQNRVRSVMVDMFSKKTLFDESIVDHSNIREVNRMFGNRYFFDGFIIRGSTRKLLFPNIDKNYCMKYPLIKVQEFDFHNTHHDIPYFRDSKSKTNMALLHYKCISGDREKYQVRAKTKETIMNRNALISFSNTITEESQYARIMAKFFEYKDFNSLRVIKYLKNAR